MSDEPSTTPSTAEPEVPEWVHEMRAKGYTVRVGTGTRGIPYHPDVSFHDLEEPSARARRRVIEFVRDLWCHARTLKRRIVHR